MEGHPNLPNAGARVRLSIAEFAAKYQTKNEVYNFMTQEVKAYCPPRDTVTAWHLRDMALGSKSYIKGADVKHLAVPQYESLSIVEMLDWAKVNYPGIVTRYLPVEKEIHKLPRQCKYSSLIFIPF